MPSQTTICLIVAAGNSTRFNQDTPKQYCYLGGQMVLNISATKFLQHPQIDYVYIVYNPEHQDLYDIATKDLNLPTPIKGGATRQESVLLGLHSIKKLNPNKILIHDAARPLINDQIISDVINKIETNKAVIPAIEIEDTLKKCDSYGTISYTVNRDGLMRAQTPQGFLYSDILSAHNKSQNNNITVTDDASIFEQLDLEVTTIKGSQLNFKITTEDDLMRAKKLLNINTQERKHNFRIGNGYDVHAFADTDKNTPNTNVRLCGIDIAYNRKLKGHSDADVAIHAITDALLGSIAAGDIGDHFPPSNPEFKNADSQIFLKYANQLIADKNLTISNIDLTIICEEPKISPHKQEMRANIARILDLSIDQISVKATTTEKLGSIGQKQGIASFCNCIVVDN